MRKPKRLAEEERRFHAAHKAKRQQRKNSNSLGGVALVTSHGREPPLATDDDGRRKTIEEWEPPAVLPVNLSSDLTKYNERLQAQLAAYRLNTKG
jgi:hypothetical protein